MAEWLAVFFHRKSTALCEPQFESVKRSVSAYNIYYVVPGSNIAGGNILPEPKGCLIALICWIYVQNTFQTRKSQVAHIKCKLLCRHMRLDKKKNACINISWEQGCTQRASAFR